MDGLRRNRLVILMGKYYMVSYQAEGSPCLWTSRNLRSKKQEAKWAKQQKRVTIMVAYGEARIRPSVKPGAALPFPSTTAESAPKWAVNLLSSTSHENNSSNNETTMSKNFLEKRLTAPLQVSNVWTTLDGTSLSDSETIHYDRVFKDFKYWGWNMKS